MATVSSENKRYTILTCLSCMPEKILSLHHKDNIIEFVLHDLAQEKCFNLERAAFLVENPDFHCYKGITGYTHQNDSPEIWSHPDQFSQYMHTHPFNQKVKAINTPIVAIHDIATELGFGPYNVHTFPMKHGNRGILLYQLRTEGSEESTHELLTKGACLLGLCPIF